MEVNLQKGTSSPTVINLTGSPFIDADPSKVAAIIDSGFPLINFPVTSTDTVRRRYKDKTIAEVNSQTHVDSIDCFTHSECDLVGQDGLAGHLIENWLDRYSTNGDSALRQAKRFTDRKDFPKYRLFWNGCWLFCSSAVNSYIASH